MGKADFFKIARRHHGQVQEDLAMHEFLIRLVVELNAIIHIAVNLVTRVTDHVLAYVE